MRKNGFHLAMIRLFVAVICVCFLCASEKADAAVTLIDFGAAEGSDTFGLSGWHTVIKDKYTRHFDPGSGKPKGTTITVGTNKNYDYQGVKGKARAFVKGEKITVTWYNNSSQTISFAPRISFTHAGRPEKGGQWYEMSKIAISGPGTGASVFEFADGSAGTYSLINVNVNFPNKQVLICDKIELAGKTDASPTVKLPDASLKKLTLVDFGPAEGGDNFGLSGWSTVIKDKYTRYFDPGSGKPKGTTITVGTNKNYDYQGVKGKARGFGSGEQIIVTWYNNSSKKIVFAPRISFTHAGRPEKGGKWYEMSETAIPAGGKAASVFGFTDGSAGNYSLINVNVNYPNTQTLICDKIELASQTVAVTASTSRSPAPTTTVSASTTAPAASRSPAPPPASSLAKGTTLTLIDFGGKETENIFGLAGWNTAIKDKYSNYVSVSGISGTTITTGNEGTYDYQGVKGTPRGFVKGEEIIVSWYNASDKPVTFRPKISFENPGRPDKSGKWYDMNEIVISGRGTASSFFDFTDASAGTYSLVNVNVNYSNNKVLICDKIQLTNDIDTAPPSVPQNLKATAPAYRTVELTWKDASDNVGVAGYRVYRNGSFVKTVTEPRYSDTKLIPSAEYKYTVTAFDIRKNESAQSKPAVISTQQRQKTDPRIYPSDLSYRGAFKLPGKSNETGWEYGGRGLTYYPKGDPKGAADGYPGSLFGTGWKGAGLESYVSEISIPAPVISPTKNVNDLNTASTLQGFQDIIRGKFEIAGTVSTYGDIAYLPKQGAQTTDKLHSAWGKHFQLPEKKSVSHSWCELNLSDPKPAGGWYIGRKNGPPLNYSSNSYLFSIPKDWAAANTPGKRLATGRYRKGGLGGRGPSLFAYGPWNEGNPPPPNAELSYVTLIQYTLESDYQSDPSHAMDGWSRADEWHGGAWLTAGTRSAVIFAGTKALGKDWYGFPDGTLYSGQKGPHRGIWGEETRSQIIFYDPEELAAVAKGSMKPYEPRPYAVLDIEKQMYKKRKWKNQDHLLWSACFDAEHGFLYVVEDIAYGQYGQGKILIHVWEVNDNG
jgi:hypothetical protein